MFSLASEVRTCTSVCGFDVPQCTVTGERTCAGCVRVWCGSTQRMSCIKVSVFLFSLLLVCNTCDTTLTHVFLALIINMVTYSVIISSIGAMLFHTPDRVGRVRHLLSIRFGGKRFRIFKCSICCILIHRNLKFFLGVFVTLTTDPRQKMPQTPAPITQAQQKP